MDHEVVNYPNSSNEGFGPFCACFNRWTFESDGPSDGHFGWALCLQLRSFPFIQQSFPKLTPVSARFFQ